MNISEFDFNLPDELIAQEPWPERDRSRLMILDRRNEYPEHRLFFEITDYIKSGDVLVINDTRVIPARLLGKKRSGGKAEVFLLERDEREGAKWECLVGGKRVRPGTVIEFDKALKAEVLEEIGGGRFKMRFQSDRPLETALEKFGQVPLPPYIKRSAECGMRNAELNSELRTPNSKLDKDRYQTVFADKNGAVAAPTAGLHFTEPLLKKIKEMGVEIATVTLHVGLGTFLPVKTERVDEHKMLPERYEISPEAAAKINNAKAEGRRLIAVGSTSMRTLEAAATPLSSPLAKGGLWGVKEGSGRTSIFIYPGYNFKIVDALITNFHLPKSTLILLVSAFAGKDRVFKAYREAIEQKYRFYSYGDAMMII